MSNRAVQKPPVLSLKEVSKNIGDQAILDEITFELYANQIVSVIGDNGSGKSTLLKVIAGFSRPDQGQIFFKEKGIERKLPTHPWRKGIFLLWQKSRVIKNLTVLQNIQLVRMSAHTNLEILFSSSKQRTEMKDELHALIESLGLSSVLSVKAALLSIGQRRLLSIVMAITCKAELLLLDEPLAGLNGDMKPIVSNLLKERVYADKTILMVEHDQALVEELSDKVFHLESGKLSHVK